jgi:glutamate-5-semialdehyde dehydrogenase
LVNIIQNVLKSYNLNSAIVQLLPVDRKFVEELLNADQYIDIIIPRGSQSLIDFVRKNAKVPVIETGAGVCHTYIEASGNLANAAKIICNAKVSRPSVCNALDTVIIDEAISLDLIPRMADLLKNFKVEIFADDKAYPILKEINYPFLTQAEAEDFGREFLSLKCSVKVVGGIDEALAHIKQFSSKHSEAIISEDAEKIERFLNQVDAAAVYANASTRFTDGGVFGLGAEIGISTQKLHARGPFALEKLVTEKWIVRGEGQVR